LPCDTNSPNIVYNSIFDYDDYVGWSIETTGTGAVYNDAEGSPDYYSPLLIAGAGPGSVTFAQTLNTVTGTEYAFSYYYLLNDPNGENPTTLGCTVGSTYVPVDLGAPTESWTSASTTFVATDDQTNLSCTAECSADGCLARFNLDAPSVVALC
jgi:hypothetical protein